jgi:hypothetical protein
LESMHPNIRHHGGRKIDYSLQETPQAVLPCMSLNRGLEHRLVPRDVKALMVRRLGSEDWVLPSVRQLADVESEEGS